VIAFFPKGNDVNLSDAMKVRSRADRNAVVLTESDDIYQFFAHMFASLLKGANVDQDLTFDAQLSDYEGHRTTKWLQPRSDMGQGQSPQNPWAAGQILRKASPLY
jgi:hypothetical protein